MSAIPEELQTAESGGYVAFPHPDASPEVLAHSLVGRIFDLLRECRAVLPKLEMPRA